MSCKVLKPKVKAESFKTMFDYILNSLAYKTKIAYD